MTKLFVPLIKGSFCPQFYTIFGKLIFWRNIDRRGPYKNGEICIFLICANKIFFGKIIYSTHQRKFFVHNFSRFSENWMFEGISTGADLTKMVNIWTILNCAKKLFFGKLKIFIILICAKKIFFGKIIYSYFSKEEFLHNFRQLSENWIFEGISTGADLTKMVKICIISICAKKIFFGKIICSTHQRKCFSTILRDFWKIELLKEYR